jgi:hypothetical protein
MKRTLPLIILVALLPAFLSAQQDTTLRKHEIGLRFASLNGFGLTYKTGKKTTLFRVTALALNLNSQNNFDPTRDTTDVKQTSYGAGFMLGFEKRIPIVKNLQFVVGLDAGVTYHYHYIKDERQVYSISVETKTWNISPQVECVIGAAYTIKDFLVISAEILPAISYSFGKETRTENNDISELKTTGFRFGISNSAAITLAYRFGK